MKWLHRLLNGPSTSDPQHAQDGAHEHAFCPSDLVSYGTRHNPDAGPDEELDRAIAIALSDEVSTGREQSPLEDDEELARRLQASYDLEAARGRASAPNNFGFQREQPVPHGLPYFRPPNIRSSLLGNKCAGCKLPIGLERFLSCMNGFWHPQCFRCERCHLSIADRAYAVKDNKPYHTHCHQEAFHPRCYVCHSFIPTDSANMIAFRSHPFWGQKYCPSHESDNTDRCCSCERLETRGVDFVHLDDGRKLCLECLDTCVMDTNDCQPLIQEVLRFYDSLGMSINQHIPILLVENQALNAARQGERTGSHHTAETRGLCLSEEQTITTVTFKRQPKMGTRNPFAGMSTQPHKLIRHCEVTAVLILHGLPRLLTGSILAHELMHAWLRLGSFPRLPHDVEEGICQVMAHKWLLSQVRKDPASSSSRNGSTKNGIQNQLGQFFIHQIQMDQSRVYGEGFRAGQIAVTKYGLQTTLNHIRLASTFPQ